MKGLLIYFLAKLLLFDQLLRFYIPVIFGQRIESSGIKDCQIGQRSDYLRWQSFEFIFTCISCRPCSPMKLNLVSRNSCSSGPTIDCLPLIGSYFKNYVFIQMNNKSVKESNSSEETAFEAYFGSHYIQLFCIELLSPHRFWSKIEICKTSFEKT